MRYHYEKPTIYLSLYGTTYTCNHPVYDKCTLFQIDNKGLAIIQHDLTVTIRQIMWALKLKPIKRERWKTCFDRKDI